MHLYPSRSRFSSFQDTEDLIQTYRGRVKYFYGASAESVDFANIQEEMVERLNSQTELVTDDDQLELQSPLSIVSGNYFQVSHSVRS